MSVCDFTSPVCTNIHGNVCGHTSSWALTGVTTAYSTSCVLYIEAFGYPSPGKVHSFIIYKGDRTAEVAYGIGDTGYGQTITFFEVNGSGIGGTMYWDGVGLGIFPAVSEDMYLNPHQSSSSNSSSSSHSSGSSNSSSKSSKSSKSSNSSESTSSYIKNWSSSSSSSKSSASSLSSPSSISSPSSNSSSSNSSNSSLSSDSSYSTQSLSSTSLSSDSSDSTSSYSSYSTEVKTSSSSSSESSSSTSTQKRTSSSSSSESSGLIDFVFSKYLTVNTPDNMNKNHFITLYTNKTEGKHASNVIFYGDTGISNMTFSKYVEIMINGTIYFTRVYSGDSTLGCCSILTGETF